MTYAATSLRLAMVAEHLFWTGAASTRSELAARTPVRKARGEASIVKSCVRKSVRECESCRAGVRGLQPVQGEMEGKEGNEEERMEGREHLPSKALPFVPFLDVQIRLRAECEGERS